MHPLPALRLRAEGPMPLLVPLLLLAAASSAAYAAPAGAAGTPPPAEHGPLGQLPPMRFPEGPSREKLIGREAEATAGPRLAPAATATTPGTSPPAASTSVTASLPTRPASLAAANNNNATSPPAAAERQPFVEPTKSAGILVGVFVGVALLGYAALLVWRRVLEKRYGNREILVNEEQFEQERDLSNFQL